MGLRDVSWAKRSGKGFLIHSSRIRIGPWGNARTDITPEMITTRAKSLIAEGQKKPVKGLISEDGEWFELIDGEIRLLGWREAKKAHGVDLDIRDKGIYCEIEEGFSAGGKINYPSTVEAIKLQLSYGTDSEPLSQYDKARSVSKLIENGEKIADLSVLLHRSEQHIRDLVTINTVPERVKKAMKPSAAAKYARASTPAKRNVDKKIESGEKVKCKDIPAKTEEREMIEQKEIPISETLHRLSDDEIQGQIKKADALMCAAATKGKRQETEKWQYFIRALRITLGYEVKL